MVVAVMTVMAVMAAEVGSGGSTGDWWWYGGCAWGQAVTRRRFCRETFETKRVFNHVLSWTDRDAGGDRTTAIPLSSGTARESITIFQGTTKILDTRKVKELML
jgi:hypothetical protein